MIEFLDNEVIKLNDMINRYLDLISNSNNDRNKDSYETFTKLLIEKKVVLQERIYDIKLTHDKGSLNSSL